MGKPIDSRKGSVRRSPGLAVFAFVAAVAANGLVWLEGADAADSFAEFPGPAFAEHCVGCHGKDGKVKGKVNLMEFKDRSSLMADVELLNDLVEVLEYEEMPPEDEPQPDAETRQRMVSELKNMLNAAVEAEQAYPPTPIRRMNRFQYNNAVVDLFDLDCVVFTLPERMMREHKDYFQPDTGRMADTVHVGSRPLGKSQMIEPRLAGVAAFPQDLRAEHGFDNRGDHLSLSPLLMESFLKLSQSITQSPDFGPKRVGVWNEFFAEPDAASDFKAEANERLKPFLQRAFRRSVDEAVLKRYSDYVGGQLERGVEFTVAMRSVAAAVLASPKFLYLFDGVGEAGESAQPIDDFELASRLSFFLWGSIPDAALLELAQSGDLKKPPILREQITRMLKDQKLKRFCDSFPAQWLQLDRIISSVPSREKFPDFYFSQYRDSMHMMMEPLLLFETVLIENQPITQLIDSDFTYRSRVLRDAYGEELQEPADTRGRTGNPTVLQFHRQPVTDRRNGGVITNAAVMTMTSGPERTQPITRGAWLATVIFNDPPDPPPADVPPLGEEPAEGEEHLTLRERLSRHRERADCRGCHEQIDPLGFALENYDPVGMWREKYENGRAVDMQGRLFRKHDFSNVVEFKEAILAEKDRFTRGFVTHLLSFALAREVGAADRRAIDRIVEASAADEYRLQTLIHQLILSEPFQSKTNSSTANVESQESVARVQ